jgi:hypothetical protein
MFLVVWFGGGYFAIRNPEQRKTNPSIGCVVAFFTFLPSRRTSLISLAILVRVVVFFMLCWFVFLCLLWWFPYTQKISNSLPIPSNHYKRKKINSSKTKLFA